MRRIVSISCTFLEYARAILGAKVVRDTIRIALREAIRRHRIEELRRSLGKVNPDLTPEELSRLRSDS